jgi:hypothetical protein
MTSASPSLKKQKIHSSPTTTRTNIVKPKQSIRSQLPLHDAKSTTTTTTSMPKTTSTAIPPLTSHTSSSTSCTSSTSSSSSVCPSTPMMIQKVQEPDHFEYSIMNSPLKFLPHDPDNAYAGMSASVMDSGLARKQSLLIKQHIGECKKRGVEPSVHDLLESGEQLGEAIMCHIIRLRERRAYKTKLNKALHSSPRIPKT